MSARVRWIVLGVALVVVLGLAGLYVFNIAPFEREPTSITILDDDVSPD